jgi:hypothetical protein
MASDSLPRLGFSFETVLYGESISTPEWSRP